MPHLWIAAGMSHAYGSPKADWSEDRIYRRDGIVELFRKLIHSGRLVKTYEEKR